MPAITVEAPNRPMRRRPLGGDAFELTLRHLGDCSGFVLVAVDPANVADGSLPPAGGANVHALIPARAQPDDDPDRDEWVAVVRVEIAQRGTEIRWASTVVLLPTSSHLVALALVPFMLDAAIGAPFGGTTVPMQQAVKQAARLASHTDADAGVDADADADAGAGAGAGAGADDIVGEIAKMLGRAGAAMRFDGSLIALSAPAPVAAAGGSGRHSRRDASTTCFYLAACQYPPGLADASRRVSPILGSPVNAWGPPDATLARLVERVAGERPGSPAALILAGDQIYADATAGLFDPATRDEPIRQAWRRRAANPLIRRLGSLGVPIVALMDDHEVVDNWEPSLNKWRAIDGYRLRLRAREEFMREMRRDVVQTHADPDQLWRDDGAKAFGVDFGRHALIVGDTRTERSARDPRDIAQASILGTRQWRSWKSRLRSHHAKHPGAWRIVATSAIVLPRHREVADGDDDQPHGDAAALASDGWDGYPASLRRLLAFLADDSPIRNTPIRNTLFVSGDEHLGCVACATVTRIDKAAPKGRNAPRTVLWSVHAGALYAPYPFARSRPDRFVAGVDRFEFDHPDGANVQTGRLHRYACEVQAWFAPASDGFVRIELPDAGIPAVEFFGTLPATDRRIDLDATAWPPAR